MLRSLTRLCFSVSLSCSPLICFCPNNALYVAEIDRVMKKVDEGVLLFDEIWEKVYSTDSQNQKEKYEMDLKKEIKKLQRLRDQIKTWIGSSDVKDKEPLIDARRLIETKMEQFKICEKETKTKTYSKEGLARQQRLDPAEQAKADCETWIREYIDTLNQLVEDSEVEIEQLSSGKGKKTNKHQIEEYNMHVSNHKFHLSKLEGIIRLVNNDRLDVDTVNTVKDDLEYYIDSYEDEDYQQAYDEDFFYEALGLDELDVVNVDRVTHVEAPKKKSDDSSASQSSKGTKNNKTAKKASLSSVIPISIGRARVSSGKEKVAEKATPSKLNRANSASTPPIPPSTPAAVPATRTASAGAAPAGGASMAAILKRETEQQEKERQKVSTDQYHWLNSWAFQMLRSHLYLILIFSILGVFNFLCYRYFESSKRRGHKRSKLDYSSNNSCNVNSKSNCGNRRH